MTLLSAPTTGAQEGIGERIGAQLDRGVDRLTEEFREGWASLQQRLDRMSVQGRVYGRLRWDKQLERSELDVDVSEDGVVTLRGRVPDPMAKEKAIRLANDTTGVTRVVDELMVRSMDE